MTRARPGRGDDGAYVVLYAILAVVLFTLAAIVLDLAGLRQGRRADRAAADLAATAGAGVLDPLDPNTTADACQAAWDYVVLNRDDADGAVSPPDCATAFAAAPCDPTTPRSATGVYGPLTVTITTPLPDGHDLMRAEVQGGDQGQAIDVSFDGAPCQRLGVRIVRDREFLFGPVAGRERGRTDVHAVARSGFPTPSTDVPAIVGLEPTGCDGVSATPDGGTLAVTGVGLPGSIVVDSDASACAAFALSAPLPSSITAGVGGRIDSFALSGGSFARAWTGNVTPAPTPALKQLGRGFLDLRYNCGAACGEAIGDVDRLRAELGVGPAAPVGVPTYAGPCAVAAGDTVVVPGDVFVDCPAGFVVDGRISFVGERTVFAGQVTINPTGCFAVNDGSCGAVGIVPRDVVVVIRGAGLTKADKGDVILSRTFLLSDGPLSIARADPFGASRLTWTAPLAGDYEDLLWWSEGAGDALLGEQQTFLVEGTMASPNATLTLEAKPGGTTQPVQAVANRVRLQGAGTFTLNPGAGRATGRVARLVKLIR